jgi:hypothetical protein
MVVLGVVWWEGGRQSGVEGSLGSFSRVWSGGEMVESISQRSFGHWNALFLRFLRSFNFPKFDLPSHHPTPHHLFSPL